MPTRASGIARAARPWPSIRWWAARTAAAGLTTAGCVPSGGVAEERRAPRLVQRRPVRDAVAQRLVHDGRVLGEPQRGVALRPAARVLQRLREIPVVQRRPGLDALCQQRVDEPPVEVETALVDRAGTERLHPRPGDREPVGAQAQLGHDRRRPRGSGGSGRPRRHRCRRCRPCPGLRRTCPRWTVRDRPRWPRPRSGSWKWPRPRGNRVRKSCLDRPFHDAADDLATERDEHEQQRNRGDQRAGEHERVVGVVGRGELARARTARSGCRPPARRAARGTRSRSP